MLLKRLDKGSIRIYFNSKIYSQKTEEKKSYSTQIKFYFERTVR